MKLIKDLINMTNSYFAKVLLFILEAFRLFLGALLVFSLFYFNLIPRNSSDLWLSINQHPLGSTILRISLVLLNIYFLLRILEIIKPRVKSPLAQKLASWGEILGDYITYLMLNFYQFLTYLLDVCGNFVLHKQTFYYDLVRKFCLLLFKKFREITLFYVLFLIKTLPRLFFLVAFSYDVLIWQHLHYTFLCLPILLISLLERFIICVMQQFFQRHWESISEFVEKKETAEYFQLQFIPEFQHVPPHFVKNFDEFFNDHYTLLLNVEEFYMEYKEWKYTEMQYIKISLIFAFWRLFLLLHILIYGII